MVCPNKSFFHSKRCFQGREVFLSLGRTSIDPTNRAVLNLVKVARKRQSGAVWL
jgi:uncharacterized Fe-S cluster protein YjdI